MRRLLLVLLLAVFARAADAPSAPRLVVDLPAETMRVEYHLTGPFGGYGGILERQRTGPKWTVPLSVNGQRADRARVIAYSADCRFMTVDVPVKRIRQDAREVGASVACEHLDTVTIPVTVVDPAPPFPDTYRLEVLYVADWSHEFFGIMDGMVASFPVRLIPIQRDGTAQVRVPDLMRDPTVMKYRDKGQFMFFLQKSPAKVLRLRPMDATVDGIPVQERYAPVSLKRIEDLKGRD